MTGNGRAIIYVPGLKPKPPAEEHRAALLECLVESLRKSNPGVATTLLENHESFRLASWGHHFYEHYRDISIDRPGIARLIKLGSPEPRDVEEAGHWHKRFGRFLYLVSDAFPFLIKWVANENMKITLRDTARYFRNEAGVAAAIRQILKDELINAWNSGQRVLLIGHSLGSVIAYDSLWELSRRENYGSQIDLFLTLGSPLGLNFVRKRLLGSGERDARRFPSIIKRWVNLSSIGDMTALDQRFADEYSSMLKLGLTQEIADRTDLVNFFRGPEGLNVHRCYAYMVNQVTGEIIGNWWRSG